MRTKLGINERTELRHLIVQAREQQDYTLHLTEALSNVLTEFDVALELLQGCLGDDGAISFPLYEGIEKFVERHGEV